MPHVKTKCFGQTADLIEEQRKEWFSVHAEFLRELENWFEKFMLSEQNFWITWGFCETVFVVFTLRIQVK